MSRDYSHKSVGDTIEEVIQMPPDALGTYEGEGQVDAFLRGVKADAASSGIALGTRVEVRADHARNCCVLTVNVVEGRSQESGDRSQEVAAGGDAAAPSLEPRYTEDGALRHPEDLGGDEDESVTGGTPVLLSGGLADLVDEVAGGGEDAGGVDLVEESSGAGPDITAADADAAEPA